MKTRRLLCILAFAFSVFCAGGTAVQASESGTGGSQTFRTEQNESFEKAFSESVSGGGLAVNTTSPASGTSGLRTYFSLGNFPGSYGAELQGTVAGAMYQEMERYYVGERQTGTLTLSSSISFSGTGDWESSAGYQKATSDLEYAVLSAWGALLYDHPELFWVYGMNYRWTVKGSAAASGSFDARITDVNVTFSETYSGARQELNAFDAAVSGAVSAVQNMRTDSSQYQTVKAIHDYVCKLITYPTSYNTSQVIPVYHSAAGAFLKGGVAVCEGYAKAVMILCRKFNIPAILVVGDAGEAHMWNYVQIGGNWYAVDATWDDQAVLESTYLLIGSQTMIKGEAFGTSRRLNTYFTESTNSKKFAYPILNSSAYVANTAAHTHSWVVVSEAKASCGKDGITYYRCTTCGATSFDIEEAFDHAYVLQEVKSPTCTEAGVEVYVCIHCGDRRERVVAPPLGHSFSGRNYVYNNDATALRDGTKTLFCDNGCGTQGPTVTAEGTKLPATIQLSVSSLLLRQKQSTSALKVSGLALGDAVKSWTSSDKKVVKVSQSGKVTAQKWSGKKKKTAKITVTLLSGLQKTVKVTVQAGTVATTKISGVAKKLTMKKGGSQKLAPVISPVTSQQKVTYSSSNKKVVTVSSSGKLTAKKKGKATITVKSGAKKVKCVVTVK